MKDNDIKHKIRLTEMESLEVQDQLRKDAEFLESLGIMDYSLLVGVHIAEYEVNSTVVDDSSTSPRGHMKRSHTVSMYRRAESMIIPDEKQSVDAEEDSSNSSPNSAALSTLGIGRQNRESSATVALSEKFTEGLYSTRKLAVSIAYEILYCFYERIQMLHFRCIKSLVLMLTF
jgi:hypothetical protein